MATEGVLFRSPRFFRLAEITILDRVETSGGTAFEAGEVAPAALRMPTMSIESGWVAFSRRLGCEVVLATRTAVEVLSVREMGV